MEVVDLVTDSSQETPNKSELEEDNFVDLSQDVDHQEIKEISDENLKIGSDSEDVDVTLILSDSEEEEENNGFLQVVDGFKRGDEMMFSGVSFFSSLPPNSSRSVMERGVQAFCEEVGVDVDEKMEEEEDVGMGVGFVCWIGEISSLKLKYKNQGFLR